MRTVKTRIYSTYVEHHLIKHHLDKLQSLQFFILDVYQSESGASYIILFETLFFSESEEQKLFIKENGYG